MLIAIMSLSAWAGVDDEVARGWYLWRTGQDEAAAIQAAQVVGEYPEAYAAHELAIAMAVARGDGASVEAEYRDRWGLDSDDALSRVALAMTLALRHDAAGPWCDEVTALVAPLTTGEPHYWATRAERLQEQRCKGTTDHADAEFRRLTRDGEGRWEEGVIAKLQAGYIKVDMLPEIERLFTESPHHLDQAWLLWQDRVAGPGAGAARRTARRALDDAVDGDDPVLVHAALQSYRKADKAERDPVARLHALDPAADVNLVRTLFDVADPPIYADIDACELELGPIQVIRCLQGVKTPESGAITAYRLAKLRLALSAVDRDAEALEAGLAAWTADPDHRYNARMFVRTYLDAAPRPEALSAFVSAAVDTVLAGRIPEDPSKVTSELTRRRLALDLDLAAAAHIAVGRPDDALAEQRVAVALEDTPKRRMLLGIALAEDGRGDDAVLQLVHGVVRETYDTAAIAAARTLLLEIAGGWHPGGLPGMLREATHHDGDAVRPHPLVGRTLPGLEALAAPELAADAAAPRARVLVTWMSFVEGGPQVFDRLEGIAVRYGGRGVTVEVVDVGLEPTPLPAERTLGVRFGGAAAMRALRAAAPPTAVVVDGRGRVRAVLAPWHWTGQALEQALDDVVPDEG